MFKQKNTFKLVTLFSLITVTGVSAVLIEHSQTLSYLGLVIIFGFSGIAAYKLRHEIRVQKLQTL